MRRETRLASCILFILSACGAGAAELDRRSLEAAAALREAALNSFEAYELVRSLTSEVGPRFAGSPGDLVAVAWAERQMKRLGFSNVHRMEVSVPRWVRGTAALVVDEPQMRNLSPVALGGSVGTAEGGVRAEVVQVSDLDELASTDAARIAGRIVFFANRMTRTRDGGGYGTAVRVRRDGPSQAAAKGAIGVVIRSIGTSDDRFAHTGTTRYDTAHPRIPAVAISNPDANLLEQLIAAHPVRLTLTVTAHELPPARSANVIGEIAGTDRGDEIVLLGAHLDAWDLGQGALDDGAGVAIVTAAARLIAHAKPKPSRTIRVVLFANEEFGLSGSNAYTEQLGEELTRHAVGLEADFGDGPVWQLGSRVPAELLPLVRTIHRTLEPLGITLGGNEADGGADLGALRRAGMPILEPRLDGTRYFDYHHTANDTLDKVDPKRLNQSVAAFAVTAYLAARANVDFPHLPPQRP